MQISDEKLKAQPGYGLTTARIYYHLPDNPLIINPRFFLRQFHDALPEFPRLNEYIGWWSQHIEADISFVTIAHSLLVQARELRCVDGVYHLKGTLH
jgi:uncharacterized protein Usg